MYFENTNYAISHPQYDSKLAITQLWELTQCTKASTTQPQVPAQRSRIIRLLPIEKENSGSTIAHALKNKARTGSSPVARVNGAASLCFTSAGTERGQCSQCCWHTFLRVQQCNLKAHFPESGICAKKLSDPNPMLKPTVILSLSSSLLLT